MRKLFIFISTLIIACHPSKKKGFSKEDLFNRIPKDSFRYDSGLQAYIDGYSRQNGSLYKFNKDGILVFYCFLNDSLYPYAEYYNKDGKLIKTEGKTSVSVFPFLNEDGSYRFSFLYSTFRKSNYKIRTTSNFNDTAINFLSRTLQYSNTGFFNLVIRTRKDVSETTLYNSVEYYDSLQTRYIRYVDTLRLKDFVAN